MSHEVRQLRKRFELLGVNPLELLQTYEMAPNIASKIKFNRFCQVSGKKENKEIRSSELEYKRYGEIKMNHVLFLGRNCLICGSEAGNLVLDVPPQIESNQEVYLKYFASFFNRDVNYMVGKIIKEQDFFEKFFFCQIDFLILLSTKNECLSHMITLLICPPSGNYEQNKVKNLKSGYHDFA